MEKSFLYFKTNDPLLQSKSFPSLINKKNDLVNRTKLFKIFQTRTTVFPSTKTGILSFFGKLTNIVYKIKVEIIAAKMAEYPGRRLAALLLSPS